MANGFGKLRLNARADLVEFDNLPPELRSFVSSFEANLSVKHLIKRYENAMKKGKPLKDFFTSEQVRWKRILKDLPQADKQ